MTRDEAEATIDRLELEARSLGRPECGFRDMLHRERVEAFQRTLLAWEAAHPVEAKRWRDCVTAMALAKTVIERHDRVAAEGLAVDRRLVGLGIGERHVAALRAPDVTVPLSATQEWWAGDSWCLVLLGGPGGGKTGAAAWSAKQAMLVGKRVRWVRALEASRKPLFGDEATRYADGCRTADLLVLDDLGSEQASDLWRSWLGDIIDARYANSRRTLASSNLSLADLRTHLGARLVDRLAEGGRVVGCGMVSRRRAPQPPEVTQ